MASHGKQKRVLLVDVSAVKIFIFDDESCHEGSKEGDEDHEEGRQEEISKLDKSSDRSYHSIQATVACSAGLCVLNAGSCSAL